MTATTRTLATIAALAVLATTATAFGQSGTGTGNAANVPAAGDTATKKGATAGQGGHGDSSSSRNTPRSGEPTNTHNPSVADQPGTGGATDPHRVQQR